MSVIELQPLVLKDVELLVAGATDDFRKHVDTVTYTPTSSAITWTGLGKNTYTDQSLATWGLAINVAQDWDSETSLCRHLYENEGERELWTFRPRAGAGPSFTSNVIITPGSIGGLVNAFALSAVTLGSDRPQLVPAGA